MDRTERFYKIDQLLQERRIASFEQIREALGVSRATVKRDLQYLRDRFSAPIVYDRLAGGYRFEQQGKYDPKYGLPGLWFNASEIHALLTMQTLLEEVEQGLLGPHIAPLQARLKSLLGSRDDAPEDIARRIRIVHAAKRRTDTRHFPLLATALLKRKRLRIRHWHRGTDVETEREVSPQRMIYYRDNWYLDCWCHLRQDIRSFAVDAIRAAAEQWHPAQKSAFEPDGAYLLEIPYANPTELAMDILRHGAGVEVLGPPELREHIRTEIAAMARNVGTN